MKNYLFVLFSLITCLFISPAFAFTVPDKPANNGYVLDETGMLTSDQVGQLNSKIDQINKSTNNELAIALIKTLDGANIEDAAQDTFRKWGVGKANLNNGVLVMVALAERKTRIQTGKGVEGDLPDLLCNDILKNTLKPHLKSGDFYGGFDATIDAISSHMENRANQKAEVAAPSEPLNAVSTVEANSNNEIHNDGIAIYGLVVVFGLMALFVIIGFLSARSARKKDKALLKSYDTVDESLYLSYHNYNTKTINIPFPEKKIVDRVHDNEAIKPVTHQDFTSVKEDLHKRNYVKPVVAAAAVAAVALTAEEIARHELAKKRQREEEESYRRKREEEEREASARRRRDEEEEERRRSSYSSSSSYDYSSSSSYDSGSSFGGGDCSGGGSSGDF